MHAVNGNNRPTKQTQNQIASIHFIPLMEEDKSPIQQSIKPDIFRMIFRKSRVHIPS